ERSPAEGSGCRGRASEPRTGMTMARCGRRGYNRWRGRRCGPCSQHALHVAARSIRPIETVTPRRIDVTVFRRVLHAGGLEDRARLRLLIFALRVAVAANTRLIPLEDARAPRTGWRRARLRCVGRRLEARQAVRRIGVCELLAALGTMNRLWRR